MKRTEREAILKAPAIAYCCDLCGIIVTGIEYGTDDYIVFRTAGRTAKAHRARIMYSTRGAYILVYGRRLYMSQIIRA